jgi:hypothetical protein
MSIVLCVSSHVGNAVPDGFGQVHGSTTAAVGACAVSWCHHSGCTHMMVCGVGQVTRLMVARARSTHRYCLVLGVATCLAASRNHNARGNHAGRHAKCQQGATHHMVCGCGDVSCADACSQIGRSCNDCSLSTLVVHRVK